MTGYEFSRRWFDFSFANTKRVKPIHTAIYFFAVERCNRLGWKSEFGFPTDLAMEALGIKNYKTYIRALQDLVKWEFIKWIQKSKNQYTANVIALVKNAKAHPKHLPEQVQSIASIDKLVKHPKPQNLETFKTRRLYEIQIAEIPNSYLDYYEWALKFQKLFLKNLKNKGAPFKKTEEANFEDYVEPIRKMIEIDGISESQLEIAYGLLDEDEFWKGVILDTQKLRQKIGQLIAQGKKPVNTKEMDIRVQNKIKCYD